MHERPFPVALAILAVATAVPGQAGTERAATDPAAAQRARQQVRRFELPKEARAAVRELLATGPAAIAPLHMALRDPRPEVVQWALFACSGLPCDAESLREPIRLLMANKHAGVAMAAARAWSALDGKGRTLLTDYQANKILDVDAGDEVTEHGDLPMVMSAARLPDGHLLAAVYGKDRVVEFDAQGHEVWVFEDLHNPSDAERLPNGNTLIADSGNQRVIEVAPAGKIVWQHDVDIRPIDVDRLANGNTLISSYDLSGVIEVDPQGKAVWQMPGKNVRDADRLPDGTTLVTRTDEQRVVLVDADAAVVQEWKIDFDANDAELLPDGHLLVAGGDKVVEFDAGGVEVWRFAIGYAGRVARYGHRAPAAPAGAGKSGPRRD